MVVRYLCFVWKKKYKLIFYLKWNCNVWEKIRRGQRWPSEFEDQSCAGDRDMKWLKTKATPETAVNIIAYCLTRPGSSEVSSFHFSFPHLVSSYFFQTLQPNSTSILIKSYFFYFLFFKQRFKPPQYSKYYGD